MTPPDGAAATEIDGWLLAAASAASSAATDLIDAVGETDAAVQLRGNETVERLADALKLALEVCADDGAPDYRDAKGQLHAAAALPGGLGVSDAAPRVRQGDLWDCGNRHFCAMAALSLVRQLGVADRAAMDWIEAQLTEAGPDFAQALLDDEVPF